MKDQNEPGYTMVPNKLMDAVITYQCTELKIDILLFMIRNTLGYHRESVTTTAVHIAETICRNKVKTSVALRELIESNVINEVTGDKGTRSRSFSINMNTLQWRPRPLPELIEMLPDENPNEEVRNTKEAVYQTGNKETSPKEISLSQSGNREISQEGTPISQPGKIMHSRKGNSSIPFRETTPSAAYIDGKNAISCSKENFKENNKRNIYMYDITLIPPTLEGRSGFKDAFNNWCIYRQEMEKPLTPLAIELDMKKLLMLSSEGYDVNQLIENAITSGWRNIYRPGSRPEIAEKPFVFKSAQDIKNESY
ncbi:MAG: replication protein [Syntrophothermus sp.]